MSGLSRLQRYLLLWTLEQTEWKEAHGSREVVFWGVAYYPSRIWPGWTKSQRVAASRALVRLEQRGLVVRDNPSTTLLVGHGALGRARRSTNEPAPKRATTVRLTEAGRAEAQWLAIQETENGNRCAGWIEGEP